MNTVQRRSYGGGPISSGGGGVLTNGAGVGETDPGIEPEPSDIAVGGKFFLNRGRKVYEMKNHLGNVLAVVSDLKIGQSTSSTVSYYAPDIVEMTDYYPFGMQMVKRHYVADARYRFGFQAQEGDDEWNGAGNMLAFKYRAHDARLGRFLSIDPLAPDYPWYSPYQFAGNTPIWAIDIEGSEPLVKSSKLSEMLKSLAPVGTSWYIADGGDLFLVEIVGESQLHEGLSKARSISISKTVPWKPEKSGYDEYALEGRNSGYGSWYGKEGLDKFRVVVDVLGMVPTVGIAFDLFNATLYVFEGDYENAANYVFFAIPYAGDGTHATYLVFEGSKVGYEALMKAQKEALAFRGKTNEIITRLAKAESDLLQMKDDIVYLEHHVKHHYSGDNVAEAKSLLANQRKEIENLEKVIRTERGRLKSAERVDGAANQKLWDTEFKIMMGE